MTQGYCFSAPIRLSKNTPRDTYPRYYCGLWTKCLVILDKCDVLSHPVLGNSFQPF